MFRAASTASNLATASLFRAFKVPTWVKLCELGSGGVMREHAASEELNRCQG